MNQTSTSAAIATVIGAYTGLIAMIGFMICVTRNKVMYAEPRRRTSAQHKHPEPQIDAPVADASLVAPRRSAEDVVPTGAGAHRS